MQGGPIDSSKWSFQGLLACDFLRRCDSQLRVLYVFVIMEVGTRRIAHCNVTTHPSADAPAVSGDHHGRETVPGSSSTTATTFTDRKSTRLNSSHRTISYAVFCLKKKKKKKKI